MLPLHVHKARERVSRQCMPSQNEEQKFGDKGQGYLPYRLGNRLDILI